MGISSSRPPLAPHGGNTHEEWRAEAKKHAEARNALFQQSQDAYRSGRKAEAKQLSDRAKVEARRMDQANRAASEAAFDLNNNGRALAANTVDLHGLYVKEALERARSAIQKAKAEGEDHVVFIVGKGTHSAGGVQKLKPAIEQLAREERLTCIPNKPTEGCVYVILEGEGKVMGGFAGLFRRLAQALSKLLHRS